MGSTLPALDGGVSGIQTCLLGVSGQFKPGTGKERCLGVTIGDD